MTPGLRAAVRRLNSRVRILGVHRGDHRDAVLRPVRNDDAPDRVLDAGCGRGELLQDFARAGVPVEYYGVDLGVGDPAWEFRVSAIADLHQLPFACDAFDKVVCSEVLEHVDEPERVFAELVRVLRPGGQLLIAVPFVWHTHQEPFDRYRFSRFALERLVHKYELDLESLQAAGGYFTVLRYLLSHPLFIEDWPVPLRSLARAHQKLWSRFDETLGGPLFYLLDQLDRSRKLTIGYFLRARKRGHASTALPSDPYACPGCGGAFERSSDTWACQTCSTAYPVRGGVPCLAPRGAYEQVTDRISPPNQPR
jgi:SAM-dependent methyltransferase